MVDENAKSETASLPQRVETPAKTVGTGRAHKARLSRGCPGRGVRILALGWLVFAFWFPFFLLGVGS